MPKIINLKSSEGLGNTTTNDVTEVDFSDIESEVVEIEVVRGIN